jgi:hypothetical protein
MSVIRFPNRAARATAERAIQEIYRNAIHEAFNRAIAAAAQAAPADFTVGNLLDVAGEVLVAERLEISRVRPQF